MTVQLYLIHRHEEYVHVANSYRENPAAFSHLEHLHGPLNDTNSLFWQHFSCLLYFSSFKAWCSLIVQKHSSSIRQHSRQISGILKYKSLVWGFFFLVFIVVLVQTCLCVFKQFVKGTFSFVSCCCHQHLLGVSMHSVQFLTLNYAG